jgi:hypothetical protein
LVEVNALAVANMHHRCASTALRGNKASAMLGCLDLTA